MAPRLVLRTVERNVEIEIMDIHHGTNSAKGDTVDQTEDLILILKTPGVRFERQAQFVRIGGYTRPGQAGALSNLTISYFT